LAASGRRYAIFGNQVDAPETDSRFKIQDSRLQTSIQDSSGASRTIPDEEEGGNDFGLQV
jgi:hypothetical protein